MSDESPGFSGAKSVNRVVATWAGGHQFDTGRPNGPKSRIDGDGITGQSPVDALLSALAACTAIDVVEILAKRRTPVTALDVSVDGARADAVPSKLIGIRLEYVMTGVGIERVHAERAIDLAVTKYCSVRDSLAADIPVVWTLELDGSEAGLLDSGKTPG